MPKPHYGARRDDNHGPLVKLATDIGGEWLPDGPFDGWLWWRGFWHLIEIKNPNKEGHADEYTKKQIRMLCKLNLRGIKPVIWRTESDVYQLLGVRRTA